MGLTLSQGAFRKEEQQRRNDMDIPFIIEARELAADDHYDLTGQLQYMRDNPHEFSARYRQEWIDDYGWCEDREQFFQARRDYYLEEARKLFAEDVA
jgi:hypothetical protein